MGFHDQNTGSYMEPPPGRRLLTRITTQCCFHNLPCRPGQGRVSVVTTSSSMPLQSEELHDEYVMCLHDDVSSYLDQQGHWFKAT
jgi:hypothetical protein